MSRSADCPIRRIPRGETASYGAIATANEKAKAFASGNQDVSLSDVMISLEQANLALQAAAAVRDKMIAAYTNVMNMPV